MKKLSLVLAILLLISVFCGCSNKEETTTTSDAASENITTSQSTDEYVAPVTVNKEMPVGELTAEEAVKIYLDNKNTWGFSADTEGNYLYLFLDLNSDGVMELVTSTYSGRCPVSYNKFYQIDKDTQSVKEIPFPDKDEENQSDFNGKDYPDLYVNNATGEIRFMTSNYIQGAGALDDTVVIGEMWMDKNGNINTRNLWALDTKVNSEDYSDYTLSYFVYDENGAKSTVDCDTYLKRLDDYEKENTNLLLDFKSVLGHGDESCIYHEFEEMDYDGQFAVLLEGYNAFKY